MKKLLILAMVAVVVGLGVSTPAMAQARAYIVKSPKRNLNDGYDKYYNRHRTKAVYVIENRRPVRRTVFVDGRGRYYREVGGRQVFIERHYDTFPTRYYYRDGRPRPGISINF